MIPKKEWVCQWMEKRKELASTVDFKRYFSQEKVGGNPIEVIRVGLCSVPSGELLVRDPINYLENREELPYFVTAPVGKYPLEIALTRTEDGEALYVAARLRFNYREAVHFEQALTGEEEIGEFQGGYYGFFSQSGLGCICDELSHQEFCSFAEQWWKENPDGKLYRDYFAPLFEESFREAPQAQNEGGSFLNWTVPGTKYRIPIFQTGWGEGQYPVYWGQDEEGRVCELVIWFVDLEEGENPDGDLYNGKENLFDLVKTDDGWEGSVRLREWEGFFEQEGVFPFSVRTDIEDEQQLMKACEPFLMQQYQTLDVMMTALYDRYPIMQLEYGHTMSENAPEMPNILDKNDFATLLYPQQILLDLREKTVSSAFSCTWDKEHGFAAVVRGETLLEMGNETLVPKWKTEGSLELSQVQEEESEAEFTE